MRVLALISIDPQPPATRSARERIVGIGAHLAVRKRRPPNRLRYSVGLTLSFRLKW